MPSPNRTSNPSRPLFALGRVVATRGAQGLLEAAGVGARELLARHIVGDWGEVAPEDAEANEEDLRRGERLLSSYPVGEERIWIITERDRSATTLLLPSEY